MTVQSVAQKLSNLLMISVLFAFGYGLWHGVSIVSESYWLLATLLILQYCVLLGALFAIGKHYEVIKFLDQKEDPNKLIEEAAAMQDSRDPADLVFMAEKLKMAEQRLRAKVPDKARRDMTGG